MLASRDKISTRQAVLLFYMSILSPAIRLFPQYTAKTAGKAGWLTPIVGIIPAILLIYIVSSFFKKHKEANLSDIYFKILGNVAGRVVTFFYLLWILILLVLYIRYYVERILSSILPYTSIYFLTISMLLMVFIAARCGLVPMARVNEIFFSIFLVIFIIIIIFALPRVSFRNYMYVSYLDTWPVIKASYAILAIWGYFLFIFFFGDKINDKEHIKRFGLQGMVAELVLSIFLIIITIGSLGPVLASRMSLPLFIVVKNIFALKSLERLESVLLSLWVISDFVTISVFTLISASIIKSIFKLSETKSLVSPVVLLAGIGTLYLTKNRFELETFSTYIALPANAIFEYIIPVIVFGIGKLRKKI